MDAYKQQWERYKIFRDEVYPNLNQYLDPFSAIAFQNYMLGIIKKPTFEDVLDEHYMADVPVIFNFDFLTRFKDRSIGYCAMSPDKYGQYGFVRGIWQLKEDFHLCAGVGVFFDERDQPIKYMMSALAAFKNYPDYLDFLNKNEDIMVKEDMSEKLKPKVGIAGFIGGVS